MRAVILLVGAAVMGLLCLLVLSLRQGFRHWRYCRSLARERGPGSYQVFAEQFPVCHLSTGQQETLFAFLSAYCYRRFRILPEDRLSTVLGVGRSHGVVPSDFLDDVRAELRLPRDRELPCPFPETIGELVALVDDEAGRQEG